MNGMSRVEYELRAQRDTVRELRDRLEALLEVTHETDAGEIRELVDMLNDYLDCVDAAKRVMCREVTNEPK
jgi:uncharacterized protein YigA (DUF484 family)